MPRLKQVSRTQADEKTRKLYDKVFGPDRDPVIEPGTATGTPGNFFTVWANAPEILENFQQVAYSPDRSEAENPPQIDPALAAIASCRTGYIIRSKFVYSQNCKTCRLAGVSEAKICAIPTWQTYDGFSKEERCILAYVDANILERGRVSDSLFAEMMTFLTDEELIALTFRISFFAMHARTCRALRLEYDDVDDRITEIPSPDIAGERAFFGR